MRLDNFFSLSSKSDIVYRWLFPRLDCRRRFSWNISGVDSLLLLELELFRDFENLEGEEYWSLSGELPECLEIGVISSLDLDRLSRERIADSSSDSS